MYIFGGLEITIKKSSAPISRVPFPLHQKTEQTSAIYLRHESPHASSILPSIATKVGRTALKQWFTRTCSLQMAQPTSHLVAGSLLHHLLTLTSHLHVGRLFSSAISYCRQQLLLSEVERPVLPGLSSYNLCKRQTGALLCNAKLINKNGFTYFCMQFYKKKRR